MKRLALLASLALLSACATRPYPAYAIEDDAEERASVVVSDRSLQGCVRVGKALVERVPGSNSLRVVVPVRNIDDVEIQVLAQRDLPQPAEGLAGRQHQPAGDGDPARQHHGVRVHLAHGGGP